MWSAGNMQPVKCVNNITILHEHVRLRIINSLTFIE